MSRGRHLQNSLKGTFLGIAALLLMNDATTCLGEEPSPSQTDAAQKLANKIDLHIKATWNREKIIPANRSDDAEFLRRVYLDLSGKIPPVSKVREFLADTSPDKRQKVVDDLLESPGYITNFTSFWSHVLIPEAGNDIRARYLVPGFEAWLRQKLTSNVSYDQLVSELLTFPLTNPQPQQRQAAYRGIRGLSPLAFYQAKQAKPENLAAASARMFLGVRIECAQCHDHPFDTWKKEQFWSFAAFFAGIETRGRAGIYGAVSENSERRELKIPGSDLIVPAAFLDGRSPEWNEGEGSRDILSRWIVSKENPYFAQTAANRIWGHLMGVGIVDPVDDFGSANIPSHPELLSDLATDFAEHHFDLKHLIRAIVASEIYQLTSRRSDASQDQPQLFARMSVKRMSSKQLVNSLSQAVGLYRPFNQQTVYNFRSTTPESEIFETFANNTESPTQQSTTILQALAMMNGKYIADATSLNNSKTLAAIIEFPMSDRERIETLYLAALSRIPRNDEQERLLKYLTQRKLTSESTKEAYSDIFWALLNSSEFLLNH